MRTLRFNVAFGILLTAATSGLAQEPVPLGGEFRINSYTTGNQARPAVSSDGAGKFVVVWSAFAPFPNDGIRGRRFNASGNALGGEFKINTRSVLAGTADPDVDSGADGNFVVVWETCYGSSCTSDVVGQRYDASGTRLGGEFQVSSRPPTYPSTSTDPKVAVHDDGSFVVVWEGFDQGYPQPVSRGIFGQRFDATGAALGGRFFVNSYTTGAQKFPDVAADPQGNFVVVWDSVYEPGKRGIFGQRYDSSGFSVGGEFQVNSRTGVSQNYAHVAVEDDGSFVVAWQAVESPCCGEILAQRFDAAGGPEGSEFVVGAFEPPPFPFAPGPAVSVDADGGFALAWASDHEDGSESGVFARRYDDAGVSVGEAFQVNTYTTGDQWQATVSAAPDGSFVVAWGEQPARFEVFGQRYAGPGLTLSSDGSCPGPTIVTVVNAPPNSEVAIVAAANTNGFTKGGTLCPGTQFEIGEPFQLPPRFVIVDGNGEGSTLVDLAIDRCHLQGLALASCEISNVVEVP